MQHVTMATTHTTLAINDSLSLTDGWYLLLIFFQFQSRLKENLDMLDENHELLRKTLEVCYMNISINQKSLQLY